MSYSVSNLLAKVCEFMATLVIIHADVHMGDTLYCLSMCVHIQHPYAHTCTHYTRWCTHTHTHTHAQCHTCTCTHVHAHTHTHVHTHMYTHTHTHTHAHMHSATHVHTHTCTVPHMYTHVHAHTVAVNKKFTFRIHTTIVLRSVLFKLNLPVLRLLSQQLSLSRVYGQVRRPLPPVTSKLQTRDKRQRI